MQTVGDYFASIRNTYTHVQKKATSNFSKIVSYEILQYIYSMNTVNLSLKWHDFVRR